MKEEPASEIGHIVITAALGLWLAGSAYMGVMVTDFHVSVEGPGYGHRTAPTVVSWGLYAIVALSVAAMVYAIFAGTGRRATRYLWGLAGGFFLWVATAVLSLTLMSLHYEHICDHTEAPGACYTVSFDATGCSAGDDSDDCRRLKRSCRLGDYRGCQRLLDTQAWTKEQVCDALATTCDKTRQCGSDAHPQHCDADRVPHFEAWKVSNVCEVYSEECK